MPQPDERDPDRINREALEWLSRISLGEAAQEDLAALRRWRDTSPAHAAALRRAGDLWRALEAPVTELVKNDASRRNANFRPNRRAFLAGSTAAAAAAIGVMIVRPPLDLWPSFAELSADYRTGTGEQRQVTLSDAVSVELNTRTSIAVRSGEQDPGIELISGETAIAVSRAESKPFVVLAAGGRTSTHRGSFNIRRHETGVDIACIDGEVSVEYHQGATLRAGQRIAYSRDGLSGVVGADVAAVTAWREGMLIFRNTPLSSVIDEVNRYRSGRIVLIDPSLGQRLVTARFEIKRLDTVMGQINQVFKVPVKTFPGGLVLVG
ncbi:FecR domain-containing protein [Bradyrhizobium sp. WSM 1738]|uniref:FecR family protein n=1 Tax=Bradyrhizobium hereditatis TaxID=2821405 RepID=UPI001CE35668|nr:FecR domain-containing protein [Bradyrhizobium hereditatis]MCA6119335.1 FecR domain-containing protein [Bradyrhizobium hereditatis]